MKKLLVLGLLLIILIMGGSVYFKNNLASQATFIDLIPKQFNQDLKTGGYTLIDVRTLQEYNAGHLKNAKQIDYYQTQAITAYIAALDSKGKYLLYDRTGERSLLVMQMMRDLGFANVSDLSGGYNAWVAAGLPVEK
jgi:rhodanese-related sulfurtransferase